MIDALVQLVHMRHTDSYDRVNVVLSLVATIFLPLTFVTGVYGMNFEHDMQLTFEYAYESFWAGCFGCAALITYLFWRSGWFSVFRH